MASYGFSTQELIQDTTFASNAEENGFLWSPNELPNGDGALIFTSARCSMWQQCVGDIHLPSNTTDNVGSAAFPYARWSIVFWYKAGSLESSLYSWSMFPPVLSIAGSEFHGDHGSNPSTLFSGTKSYGGLWVISTLGSRLAYTQAEWGDDKARARYIDFTDQNWHMVTFAVENNTIDSWLDATPTGTLVNNVGFASSSNLRIPEASKMRLSVGHPGSNLYIDQVPAGTGIAKVQLFCNTKITQTEVTALYNAMTT